MERKSGHPNPRLNLGPLKTATQIRMAFKRLGQAVLDQRVSPKVANSAMYAVAGAARAFEIEVAERLAQRLAERSNTPAPAAGLAGLLSYDGEIVEGEVV